MTATGNVAGRRVRSAADGQAGSQAAVRISPNSRAIFRHDSPASSVTYTSLKSVHATMRCASASWVARPQMVAFGRVGSSRVRHVVHVGIVKAAHDAPPAVAAVVAPEDTVDLDADPQRARMMRVNQDAGDERRPDRALGCSAEVELVPLLAAIVRTIEASGPRPRVDRSRIDGIDGE